jgi:hypothetical protein
VWGEILSSVGAAVMGATVTELVESRRRARDAARSDLRQLKVDVQAAHEQALLAATQMQALNQRVNDVLNRLNREAQ